VFRGLGSCGTDRCDLRRWAWVERGGRGWGRRWIVDELRARPEGKRQGRERAALGLRNGRRLQPVILSG
jgi:hypothetical protein